MTDRIRIYRITYEVPPLADPPQPYNQRVYQRDPATGAYIEYDQWRKCWTREVLDVAAYDMDEARKRLNYRLCQRGYLRPGQGATESVFAIIDIEPLDTPPETGV